MVVIRDIIVATVKPLLVLSFIWLVVLLLNYPVITFDMMYEEQPLLYVVNQQITSWHDLLNIYLHPHILEALTIPFFRPSGHFLVYQIITQFFDWHNLKAFALANFFFLALTCYLIIQLYQLLFPRMLIGAYFACGIYLMHPALALSRLTPMHFEFASVAFLLISLNLFIVFCQKNSAELAAGAGMRCTHLALLGFSLMCYFVSATFKETTLMLGPVLVLYLLVAPFSRQYGTTLLKNNDVKLMVALITVFTLMLATYLSMAWPGFSNPMQNSEAQLRLVSAVQSMFAKLFGFWENDFYPHVIRWVLRSLLIILLITAGILLGNPLRPSYFKNYQKAFFFLALATLAFMLMPIIWGRCRPWHLALSLVFASLMMGFSLEYLIIYCLREKIIGKFISAGLIVLFGIAIFFVASSNTSCFKNNPLSLPMTLNYNAIVKPPAIKQMLNNDSVVVVEDSMFSNSYLLGDSAYPLEPFVNNFDIHRLLPAKAFYKFPYQYAGTLFKWAYLLPALKEETYPFSVAKMKLVNRVTLYHWLSHYNNIFCLGYDNRGEWHDKTVIFKKNLLAEKSRQRLLINEYKILPGIALDTTTNATVRLPFADPGYCQFRCDGNPQCKGFTYVAGDSASCYFYLTLADTKTGKSCSSCQVFVKDKALFG
jgi:hypothetical protein